MAALLTVAILVPIDAAKGVLVARIARVSELVSEGSQ